jgi:hypothetical protein
MALMGEEIVQGSLWESPKKRDHSEDRGLDGRMGLDASLETGWGSVEWIQLAQDRDLWLGVVSAVMNLWVLAPRS